MEIDERIDSLTIRTKVDSDSDGLADNADNARSWSSLVMMVTELETIETFSPTIQENRQMMIQMRLARTQTASPMMRVRRLTPTLMDR